LLIIFVGLPGSGKTTIGRQMGRRLGLPFLDSDSVIEQRLGCSIREFFDREGEERFRDIEQNVLDDLSKYHHGVAVNRWRRSASASQSAKFAHARQGVFICAQRLKRFSED